MIKIKPKIIKDSILEFTYPVGSIYLSVNSINPSILFGGTWELFGSGRVLVGVDTSQEEFNAVEKIGGAKTQDLRALIGATNGNPAWIGYSGASPVPNSGNYIYSLKAQEVQNDVSEINHTTNIRQNNGNMPTTIQPYITCYMWKRIA